MKNALKILTVLLLVAILGLGLVACTPANKGDEGQTPGEGDTNGVGGSPERIISLFPSNTEILVALGLLDQLVGVTIFDDYPADIQSKVEYVFTDGLNPNVEQALSLEPDLVVLGAHSDELVSAFKKLGIPTVLYDPQSVAEVYETIIALGDVTGRSAQAAKLVAEMRADQAELEALVADLAETDKRKVWLEISNDLWTAGQDTFMNELISLAGGISIVEASGWVQYSEEKVLEQDPDIIFTTYGSYDPEAVANVLKREGWSNVAAVRAGNVHDLDNNLVSRQGARIIEALEAFMKKLYPELFYADQAA